MRIVIAIGAAIVLSALALWVQAISVRRRIAKRMQARDMLDVDGFGTRFFSEDVAPIATRLRIILARHVDIDLTRLRPDDGLIADLEMDELDSLSTVAFATDIEREFGITIPDADAVKLTTFREVVEYIHRALARPVA